MFESTIVSISFNTQPPKGGWGVHINVTDGYLVSTHSRLKAAGHTEEKPKFEHVVSTHSRLKAAGIRHMARQAGVNVSTHSRLKAAGQATIMSRTFSMFQHTAA